MLSNPKMNISLMSAGLFVLMCTVINFPMSVQALNCENTGYGYFGDIITMFGKVKSSSECKLICQSYPECAYYSWRPSPPWKLVPSEECVLYPIESLLRKHPFIKDIIAGPKFCMGEKKAEPGNCIYEDARYDSDGKDTLQTLSTVPAVLDCKKKCLERDACAYFTWDKPERKCHLYRFKISTVIQGWIVEKNRISGPKYCPSVPTQITTTTANPALSACLKHDQYFGAISYREGPVIHGVSSELECQSICQKFPDCQFFNYYSGKTEIWDTSQYKYRCVLKKKDNRNYKFSKKVGMVSGPKYCSLEQETSTASTKKSLWVEKKWP